MKEYVAPIENLIDKFASLPSIGKKTAQKIAFYLINKDQNYVDDFINAIINAKKEIFYCSICGNLTDINPCFICIDNKRDKSKICVVETPQDVMVIEKTDHFNGLYHILHGSISPMSGIGPEDINIKSLLKRLDNVEEVIIATNPNVEGETTAVFLYRLLKSFDILVTRIAHGVSFGSDLEFADTVTLSKALEYRTQMN